MITDFKTRALRLPPQELRELDGLLDQNPRILELLLKIYPELDTLVGPPGSPSGAPAQAAPKMASWPAGGAASGLDGATFGGDNEEED